MELKSNEPAIGKTLHADIAILIPCYNESATIKNVINDFHRALPHAHIFVYDNNSSDDSVAQILEYKAHHPDVLLDLRFEKRQGKGHVISSMFNDIEANVYVMVDADSTYHAHDAQKLITLIQQEQVDMAVGDRLSSSYFEENTRRFHNFGNRLIRNLVNLGFNKRRQENYIHDIMTGYRAFSRSYIKSFPCESQGFEIETEMTIFALKNNFKVACIPIAYNDRPEGSTSKLNTFKDGLKILVLIFMFMFKLKKATPKYVQE